MQRCCLFAYYLMNRLRPARLVLALLPLLFTPYASALSDAEPKPVVVGSVRSTKGEPVGYAAITLSGTTSGAVASADGRYVLVLPQRGRYSLQVRSLGYRTITQAVAVSIDTLRLDFTLEEEDLILPDQIITSNGEDPAYGIIRAAIRRRRINNESVQAFSVKAYTKIIGIDRAALKRQQKAAATGKKSDKKKSERDEEVGVGGIVFLSESYSTKYVEKPNREKEIVHNSRVSGDASSYSALASLGVVLNPYRNLLAFPRAVFPREFVSPIADNALFFYRYKLLGTFRERGFTVYKIEVTPRRPADPVVAGLIYIVDESYAIKGLEWSVNKDQPMRYFDTLTFKQDYLPVRDSLWVPFTNSIGASIRLNLLVEKVDAYGSLLNVFSDYNITNPPPGGAPRPAAPVSAPTATARAQRRAADKAKAAQKAKEAEARRADAEAEAVASRLGQVKPAALDDSTERELRRLEAQQVKENADAQTAAPAPSARDPKFWDELIRVEQNVTAKNKNTAFWDSLRPSALTQDELKEFKRGDSLQFGRDSTKILDSLYKRRHRFEFFPDLGWRFNNPRTKTSYGLGFSFFTGWNYNTVEGWNLELTGNARWKIAERKFVRLEGAIRYGIANERFSYRMGGSYPLNTRKQEYLFFEGGYYPAQFSAFPQLRETVNTFYSLLGEENFMKLYQRAGGSLTYQRRLTKDNILQLEASAWRREPMINRAFQSWNPIENRDFTPNQPPPPDGQPMRDHEAASIAVRYLLRFSSKYITTPDGTFYLNNSAWPRLSFEYVLGMQRAADFATTYHRAGLRIDGSIDAKLLGETNYRFRGQKMWRNGPLEIPDALHVRANQTIFRVDEIDRFGILDYYRYVSTDRMVETHVEHNFRGFWLNKIPLIRKLKWHEIVGLHHVAMPGLLPHSELLVGLSNIRVLRLDLFRINYHLVVSGENSLRSGFTFTIGIGL